MLLPRQRLPLQPGTDFGRILAEVRKEFKECKIDERDGMKIDLPGAWVQIRKSNTEPIIRIYSEGKTVQEAENLAGRISTIVKKH